MVVKCPRRPDELLPESECYGIILSQPTGADLAPCLACERGQALAATSPFRRIAAVKAEDVVPVVAPAVMPEPVAALAESPEVETPAPKPEPVAVAEPEAQKPARARKPKAEKTMLPPKPRFKPGPVRSQDDEIAALRSALAYLMPKKYRSLGLRFLAMAAQRFGMKADVAETALAAGLTVATLNKTPQIVQNKALFDFVHQI